MKNKLYLSAALLLFTLCQWQGLFGQTCTGCTQTVNMDNVTVNATAGIDVICITADVVNTNFNNLGAGDIVCVAPGVTWTMPSSLNYNGLVTYIIGTGATVELPGSGSNGNLQIDNYGTLNFTNAFGTVNFVANGGSTMLVNNFAGATLNATMVSAVIFGNGSDFFNEGTMNFNNVELAESASPYNGDTGIINVKRAFYLHSFGYEDYGQLNVTCETTGNPAWDVFFLNVAANGCGLTVGDKGPFSVLLGPNNCTVVAGGRVLFGGPTTIEGYFEVTGDFLVEKRVDGTGSIVVVDGDSRTQNDGSLQGGVTFYDENTTMGFGNTPADFPIPNGLDANNGNPTDDFVVPATRPVNTWVNPAACTIDADGLATVACSGADVITFDLMPTGTDVSASYSVMVSGGSATSITPNTGNYGATTSFTLNTGSAGGGDVTVTISDANGCMREVTVTDPGSCSTPTPDCVVGPGIIGGNVFNDLNNDGADAGAAEVGQSDVLVQVYDCDGNLACEVYTNADGNWSCAGLTDGEDYRVEFSTPLQSFLQPSYAGVDNGTDVQFAQPGTCEVNFGVINLGQYCGTPLYLATPCYIEGDAVGSEDAIVFWSYDNVGTTPQDKTSIATNGQVGSTWGLAYDAINQRLYSGTVVKRGIGLYEGSDGSGTDVIFATNPFVGSANSEVWLQLTDDLGIATDDGSFPSNADRGLTGPDPLDQEVFSLTGKVGLGDIDISDDGSTLYVMNLYDRTLYAIDIVTKTLVAAYPVPDPGCTNGTYRPWATKYADGTVYIGVVCDASQVAISSPPTPTDDTARPFLEATVYRLDGTSFTEVLSTPLDYAREATFGYSGGTCTDDVDGWYGWVDTAPIDCEPGVTSYPQPILTDLEFDDAGGMILGFSDRSGFQITNGGFTPDGSRQTGVYAGGDILYACNGGSGSWTIENPVNCTNSNGEAINGTNNTYQQFIFDNGWPRIGEYFVGDFFHDGGNLNGPGFFPGHAEITTGGLVYLSGSNEIVSTAYDPITGEGGLFNRGGVIKLSTLTGRRTVQGFELYNSEADGGITAGKGVGLGDLELLCAPPPIQIGNYVWNDENGDGIQQACEAPIANVNVALYDNTDPANPVFIGFETTGSDGIYYFNDLTPDSDFLLVFGYDGTNSQLDPVSGELAVNGINYQTTVGNSGEGATPDVNDSDAIDTSVPTVGDFPTISFNSGTATNHDLDAGFLVNLITTVGDFVFVDVDMDGTQSMGDLPLENVTVTVYDAATMMPVALDAAGMPYTATQLTGPAGEYLFENLPPGSYYVEFDLSTATNADFYNFTQPNVGDDANDSDATPAMADDDVALSGTTPELLGGESDLTLDAGVVCTIAVEVAEPSTICSTQPIDLTTGASITPASLGGVWTTLEGTTGTFDDGAGVFGAATTYTPSEEDASRGYVTLVLTTNTPPVDSGCMPVSASVRIEILKVDCGTFPWDGSND